MAVMRSGSGTGASERHRLIFERVCSDYVVFDRQGMEGKVECRTYAEVGGRMKPLLADVW